MEIFLLSSLIFLTNLSSIYNLISLDRPAHLNDLELAQRNLMDLENAKKWENDQQSRRLFHESMAGKKSIFRDRQTSSSFEQDQFVEELAKKMREEKDHAELRFLRNEPGKREKTMAADVKSPFDQAKLDSQFPVHKLCGPWNSGRQTIDLEWAEPADKLLKLLNSGKQKYNLFMAPGQMTGHATNVSIAIYIESMSSFKAQTMDFEVDMYFAMGWYDRRLAHNCTHPLLIAHKPIAERIWTPDLYFLNAKFAYLQEVTTPNFMVIVYPDGLVFKTLRIDVTLSCNMDLQLFPFDKQECPMVIQSFAYIESMLNLSWHVDPPFYPIATNPELKLNDMAITGMRFERCSSPYTMFRGTGVWSCLRGYIVMKRLVLFHLIQTYIPSGMLVSISWMTFWLDPRASPARISLTITSLLTLTTMSNGARQDLPQVSYIKAMDIWQTFSQALIFLVLLEYSFVSFYYTRRIFCCLHHRRQSVDARRNSKCQSQMMRQTLTSDDVRLLGQFDMMDSPSMMHSDEANNNENNNNNNFLRPPEMLSNSPHHRRRHSTPKRSTSTLTMTMPPPTKATTTIINKNNKPINGLEGFRHRKLCTQPSDFELVEMAKGGTGEGEMESSREEESWGGIEKHCKKCQFLDQQKARAIDKYSRLLFPGIFVGFCSLYWLYYMRMVIADQEN